ncbi:uncharacterized protein LOC131006538 [Salvia miltiorrhiza]|uniref:uncharacterized protein LOC131006538 n=1 Tax=Salvia miltiorrhiza TaxID=226208 RepID=UPI0025AB6F56|nr:uncharacterized protein LOC131006538 [Salvia miltiorrhiza]
MARPRFDDEGNEIFSGKVGVFPLVTQQPALRRSRNREAGTLEVKPVTSVTREIIREFLLAKVIPKIWEVWPTDDSRSTIFIQQDNARTHVDPNDVEFQEVASQNGFDIRLMCQPANSLDFNILDLGFFRAIQSMQEKKKTNNIAELIQAVEMSFAEYSSVHVNRVWITYQLCMVETMKVQGSNKYKIPRVNKARLEREGCLPKQITCDPVLVENVRSQLQS